MRVESPAATPVGSEIRHHTSPGKARAHGLLRKLQDDTFNGASLEMHRARFADRLSEIQVEDSTAAPVSPDEETNGAAGLDPETSFLDEQAQAVDGPGSESAAPDESVAMIQDEIAQGIVATPFYDSSFALYPVSGTGQHVQWIA